MRIIEIRKTENKEEDFFCYEIIEEDGTRIGNITEGSYLFESVLEKIEEQGVSEILFWDKNSMLEPAE